MNHVVTLVPLHKCVCVCKKERKVSRKKACTLVYVLLLIVQQCLFCYSKTYVLFNSGNHWQGKCV